MFATNEEIFLCVVENEKVHTHKGMLPRIFRTALNEIAPNAVSIGRYESREVFYTVNIERSLSTETFSLRDLLGLPAELFALIGKAFQLSNLKQSQPFCSKCGALNNFNQTKLAMQCDVCQVMHYPHISPCIIVAIKREDKILLARHRRHIKPTYTVIAGFVEPGESLEQAVRREVLEETGLNITNIRYFSSQPWAFPSNLMVGFLADYESGSICIEHQELVDADWFSQEELPSIPPKGTIARALIERCFD